MRKGQRHSVESRLLISAGQSKRHRKARAQTAAERREAERILRQLVEEPKD